MKEIKESLYMKQNSELILCLAILSFMDGPKAPLEHQAGHSFDLTSLKNTKFKANLEIAC